MVVLNKGACASLSAISRILLTSAKGRKVHKISLRLKSLWPAIFWVMWGINLNFMKKYTHLQVDTEFKTWPILTDTKIYLKFNFVIYNFSLSDLSQVRISDPTKDCWTRIGFISFTGFDWRHPFPLIRGFLLVWMLE